MYHYVYRLEDIETKQFYFGSRSCKIHPTLDSYFGSMATWKPDKTKLKKEIIKDNFQTRSEAIEYESKLIKKYIDNSLNENYHIPNKGFHVQGLVTVKDKNGNYFKISKNDPRYLSGELVHNMKGLIHVKDINGKILTISKNDPRYLSGELVGVTRGIVIVKDKNNNIFSTSINDPRYLSGELVHIWKGKKHSEETKEKLRQVDRTGIKNSQYGTCWIYKGNVNKKIPKEQLKEMINIGWSKGRKIK